jgi:UDP-3-O-acyl N-acetylglucosamine deacetylase
MVAGYGYWSGRDVRVEFRPAPPHSGIVFVRDDLGPTARVPALVKYRVDVPRRTNLRCRGAEVGMVEHILAALSGLGIDNCEVGVDAEDMPGCDGSSLAFVQALDAVGTEPQSAPVKRLRVTETVRIESGESWIQASPNASNRLSVEYQLNYPHDPVIGQQEACCEVSPAEFRREIASCRTFVMQREADELSRRGLGRRVTTRDLLIFDSEGPVENVLRYKNECARHKVLDLIGDMALVGQRISARVIAYRSSHKLNAALAEELVRRFAAQPVLRASA